MNAQMKIVSSLMKIRNKTEVPEEVIKQITALKGESINFQIYVEVEEKATMPVKAEGDLAPFASLYEVHNVNMDYMWLCDDDVITEEPGLMPDLLVPISDLNGYFAATKYGNCLWVNIKLPEDIDAGEYNFEIVYGEDRIGIVVEVVDQVIAQNTLKYTQWFHVDCIASYYNVPMYSEQHWKLIESFMGTARDIGINMILTPILPFNMDTILGIVKRPNCGLVDICVDNGEYYFGFSKLDRYIDLSLKCGMEYFEISHLFHPGGAYWCNNVEAVVDGEKKYIFDSFMRGNIPEYVDFLKAFVPSVVGFLKQKGVFDKCYFHISDEPNDGCIDDYEFSNNYLRPMFEGRPLMDALSNVEYCNRDLVDIAVADMEHVENFFDTHLSEKWCYYCCGDWNKNSNRFLNMHQYRNRILGLQLYKFDMDGFLHWGYNFYYCSGSYYPVNPYVTTSAGRVFPSGDAFSVYPGKNGAYLSMRALVFKDALEDVQICKTLEKFIGKDAVVKMIDEEAKMNVTFFEYPRNSEYIPKLMDKMRNMIKEYKSKE